MYIALAWEKEGLDGSSNLSHYASGKLSVFYSSSPPPFILPAIILSVSSAILGPGEFPPHLGRRGSPCSAPHHPIWFQPTSSPSEDSVGAETGLIPWRRCELGCWSYCSLSTSTKTHNWRVTQEDDKEGIMRWLSQVVLQKQQHIPYPDWQRQNVPGSSETPTLTSQAAVCFWASLSFRDTSDIHFIPIFPANV